MAIIKITRVKKGEAPGAAGRISITYHPGEYYSWTGTLDLGGTGVTGGNTQNKFPTVHEAETDAVAWALSHGATQVLIEGPDA
jgi:hypothetical protein